MRAHNYVAKCFIYRWVMWRAMTIIAAKTVSQNSSARDASFLQSSRLPVTGLMLLHSALHEVLLGFRNRR